MILFIVEKVFIVYEKIFIKIFFGYTNIKQRKMANVLALRENANGWSEYFEVSTWEGRSKLDAID